LKRFTPHKFWKILIQKEIKEMHLNLNIVLEHAALLYKDSRN